MGLYDRDYLRDVPDARPRRSVVNAMRLWSVTTWLIVINVLVFVLDGILGRKLGYQLLTPHGLLRFAPLEFWGHFSAHFALAQYQVWRFLTFQFLHANLEHILFNMLALYFFGPLVESWWGSRRFLAFYLLCGMAGPVAYLGFWSANVLIASPYIPLVGASAGIFGVLIAAAYIAPDATVMLLFPPIPMKMKTLAWVFIGIAVFTVYSRGYNAGGEAAHLGGAAAGYLLMRFPRLLSFARPRRGMTWRP